MKLLNVNYNVRLHSHDIKYGSGSGQQSVTGINTKEDGDSYWFVKAASGKPCVRGYVTIFSCITFCQPCIIHLYMSKVDEIFFIGSQLNAERLSDWNIPQQRKTSIHILLVHL